MKGLVSKVSPTATRVKMSGYALVDSDHIDFSDDKGITEDNTANTTLGVSVRIGKNCLRYRGNIPKLQG